VDDASEDGTREMIKATLEKRSIRSFTMKKTWKGSSDQVGLERVSVISSLFRMLTWNMIPGNTNAY